MQTKSKKSVGKVYLVGAGPGDPGLITLRGQRCLEVADYVLYDGLANEQLLHLAPQAVRICVGKHGRTPIWSQDAIHAKLDELAKAGNFVVRLKGGDPAVFARTAEELEFLSAAGIPFEVVPGITAALAAASYVGIPITHRQYASAVAFITGQQQTREAPQVIDWRALACFPGTLVFYMGVTTAEKWTSSLIAAGKPADTPAAIIRRCTWPDQHVIRCSLGEVARELTPSTKLRPPVIVIVGPVAALGSNFDWFSALPLRGCGVLSTRPQDQTHELTRSLRELGASVYFQPMLEIFPPADFSSLDSAIELLKKSGEVIGITFSSSNGVEGFMRRLFETDHDARALAGCQLATVGPATAAALERFGLRADRLPAASEKSSAAALLKTLANEPLWDSHWIVTVTNRSRDTLRVGLENRGARVTEALCYETRTPQQLTADVADALRAGHIQFCTVTSPSIAETTYRLLQPFADRVKPISLSDAISERLIKIGWTPVAQAEEHSTDSLVEAIVAAHKYLQ